MSRIENALEKAIQMRNEGVPPIEKQTAPRSTEHESALTEAKVVTINPANRLLTTINDPYSVVSEQYRKLKSALVHLINQNSLHNLIMVTSAIAGEGKSLTAVNLAVSMAQEFDFTVLLIDADLRRPTVHQLLGFESTIGMADCLMGDADISDVIIKTDIEKLAVIPAGRVVENPLELFNPKKMQIVMEEIKLRYNDRYVIIDTPPLLPFAETRSLAHQVDGILFVVHEGVTQQESILEAMELLKGCTLLGVVLNDSNSINKENSHYSTYYHNMPRSRG